MPESTVITQRYVLGLDLGSASLGWALIGIDAMGIPVSLIRAGVRIFEPGVDGSALEIQQGKDQSKAVDRRAERLRRRQLRRRVARQRELFGVLQGVGLLPTSASKVGVGSEARHQVLNDLDATLIQRYAKGSNKEAFSQMPLYALRKKALYEPLALDELGRVFFHLSQRRGFQSNRKDVKKKAKEDENQGQVKSAIHDLEQAIEASGAQTLGEYLAGLDPHEQKVRRQWTGRKMFEKEFEKIWDKQKEYHAALLTPELHDRIWNLLFFQRPVSDPTISRKLVGKCELEPGERRAPWASLPAQEFRILQKVNGLKLIGNGAELALNEDGRAAVLALLEKHDSRSFQQIKKHLGLPEETKFNLERGAGKNPGLQGNRTLQSMRRVFSDSWNAFSPGKQNQIIENWRNSEKDEDLKREAMEHWGLDEDAADRLVKESPAKDYCALSLKALNNILPLMRQGIPYMTAKTQIYGDGFSGATVHPLIPVLRPSRGHHFGPNPPARDPFLEKIANGLRNPAVERAVAEMRKVVNAIVREHGKPYEIRIELARELKKPRSERAKETTKNRDREAANKKLAERMLRECGLQNPSRADFERAKLWFEQNEGECPYTGHRLPFNRLFDDSNGWDVDHILPRSRVPDDSYQNKVLCVADINRRVKGNKTPYEAFSADADSWNNEILFRVKQWKNPGKLKKFEMDSTTKLEEFSSRQLNDTRYTSLIAARLLSTLYGGRDIIDNGKKRQVIYSSTGAITATLRRNWGFEEILRGIVVPEKGEQFGKPRTDHRHHAVDAIVIALTRNNVLNAMAQASALEPWQQGTRSWRRIPQPWQSPNFFESVRRQIDEMLTSHRQEHKVSGKMHDGTNYGRPTLYKGEWTVISRKPITKLSKEDIEAEEVVVDKAIRDALRIKLNELGGNPKAFEKPENIPYLTSKNSDKKIPIRKVRVHETRNPITVGKGPRERFVYSSEIHHVELFVTRDTKRREKWDSRVVQITEAYERRRSKKAVVSRALADDAEAEFLFSLAKDDTFEIKDRDGRKIVRVKSFYDNKQIFYVPVNFAGIGRVEDESKKPNTLKPLEARKVVIDLLGRVHPAND